MNVIALVGRTGREPETKTTPSGSKVVTLSLGVERRSKDKTETDWIDCTVWGKTADFVEQYVRKGDRIGIKGSLQTRSWEAQDGQNRKAYFVLVENVDLLSDKKAETPSEVPTKPNDMPFEI